jgi:hypothetical protein
MAPRRILNVLLLGLLSSSALAHDYPTMDRVDHVLTCMKRNGGQNVDNLFRCSCEIDVIAQTVSMDEFNTARTYEIYKNMPGEKGALFREGEDARKAVETLSAARKSAEKRCFVGARRQTVVPTPEGMPKTVKTPEKTGQ